MSGPDPAPPSTDDLGHPRGTLAIVLVFGALFGVGWLALYVWRFLERGAPHG